jgi:hypothetical protein
MMFFIVRIAVVLGFVVLSLFLLVVMSVAVPIFGMPMVTVPVGMFGRMGIVFGFLFSNEGTRGFVGGNALRPIDGGHDPVGYQQALDERFFKLRGGDFQERVLEAGELWVIQAIGGGNAKDMFDRSSELQMVSIERLFAGQAVRRIDFRVEFESIESIHLIERLDLEFADRDGGGAQFAEPADLATDVAHDRRVNDDDGQHQSGNPVTTNPVHDEPT